MNKKILLGSIIAVVILVLVSFTGVVGYQTTKSSSIAGASPLFSIRSKRAIDEESRDITSDYVGKGEETNILFPKQDERTTVIQKFIELISNMDDKELNEFKALIKNQKFRENRIKYEGATDNIIIGENISKHLTSKNCYLAFLYSPTLGTTICNWVPKCMLYDIVIMILIVFFGIIDLIDEILNFFTLTPCGKCGPWPETCTLRSKLKNL